MVPVLVTRMMHAKYQCSIINTPEDMSQVKVFVTDGRTDGQRDGQMRFNVPTLSQKPGTTRCPQIPIPGHNNIKF